MESVRAAQATRTARIVAHAQLDEPGPELEAEVAGSALLGGSAHPDGSICEDADMDGPTLEQIVAAETKEEEEEAAAEAADLAGAPVSLGFAELPEDEYLLESAYFPSKIGGKPAWLHPAGVTADKNRCPHCGGPLSFLLQIYAHATQNNAFPPLNAFHRSIFLFACRESSCHAKMPPALPPFRVWRSQLPRHSPYYSPVAPDYSRPPPTHCAPLLGVGPRCALCGASATKRCSGCQSIVYCTAEHQR